MSKKAKNPETFAKNLKQLRKAKGLSLEELANETGLTRQTVSKYEKGEADPSFATLTRFSSSLNTPIEYFFNQANSEFEDFNYGFVIKGVSNTVQNIKYREAEKLENTTEEKVKLAAWEKLRSLLEVEKIMGDEIKFKNPVKNLNNINTKEKAEAAALELRKKWRLYDSPFSNVVNVLEREGIKVVEVTADSTFEGLSARYMDLHIIVLNDAIKEVTRRRFTALHELGHLVLQIPEGLNYEKIERICDAFAAMLILPKELLIMELGSSRANLSMKELNLIKEKYGISVRALLVSAGFAGIISWPKYKEMCGNLEMETITSYQNPEIAARFKQLLYRGVMMKKIDRKKFIGLGGEDFIYDELKEELEKV